MTTWFVTWPRWSGRWFGWLLRLMIGAAGFLFGALLVWVADFGASFKQTTPEWGFEEMAILVAGLANMFASIWVLARPSKASITLLAVSVVGTLLLGGSI